LENQLRANRLHSITPELMPGSSSPGDVKRGTLRTPTCRSDDLPDQIISVQSDYWLGHQGAKTENTKSATTPELMTGSAPNCYRG
jgi:hypothetical protein